MDFSLQPKLKRIISRQVTTINSTKLSFASARILEMRLMLNLNGNEWVRMACHLLASACSALRYADCFEVGLIRVLGVYRSKRSCSLGRIAISKPRVRMFSRPKWTLPSAKSKCSGRRSEKYSSQSNCAIKLSVCKTCFAYGRRTPFWDRECRESRT